MQGTWWQPKEGSPILISGMDPSYRANCLRFMERRAHQVATAHTSSALMAATLWDASDHVMDSLYGDAERIMDAPLTWLKGTPLYRAMARGLPATEGNSMFTESRREYARLIASYRPGYPPTHPYAGTSKARAGVGDPGHCDHCAVLGHVRAHPDLGCGDVGCNQAHSPANPHDVPLRDFA